jgi:hypothetical protein
MLIGLYTSSYSVTCNAVHHYGKYDAVVKEILGHHPENIVSKAELLQVTV